MEKLYKLLFEAGDYTKSYEEFVEQYGDSKKSERLYKGLSESGDYTKSFEEFNEQYGFNDSVKKKDSSQLPGTVQGEDMESTTGEVVEEVQVQDGSLVSGEKPVRERSYIEEQIDIDIEDAPQNTIITKGGNIIRTGYKDDEQGVTYNKELSDALYADTGIQRALKLGKLTEEEIKNATSNKKTVRAEALEKIKEFRYKSAEEIDEITLEENLTNPFIYTDQKEDDEFMGTYFENVKSLKGINVDDFNGFISSKGYKKDYQYKADNGLYDSSSNYAFGGQKENRLAVQREMDELRMLTLYLEDVQKRDRKSQELEYRKNNKGLSMKAEDLDYRPTKYIDPNSLSDFIKTNMPNYVNQLKENQIKAETKYQKYKDNKTGVGFSLWEMTKAFGGGVDDRINQLSSTMLDLVGADVAATDNRMAEEYEAFIKDPNLHFGYVSGKQVEVGGVNYIVNENGNIFDVDHKINVTGVLDANSQKIIREQAKKNGKKDWSGSVQGMAIDTSGVVGGILTDILLTKGVSSSASIAGAGTRALSAGNILKRPLSFTMETLKSVPISRGLGSAFIAQSTIGMSSGIETTLKEAKKAGLNDDDANKLALEAGGKMALLYGATSFISPQTKATELLFGRMGKDAVVKVAVEEYKKGGIKSVREFFNKLLPGIGDAQFEGFKELIQENVQQAGERFVVNPSLNDSAKQKIMTDTISGDEFVNTSVLSYAAGMLIPFAGSVKSNTVSLFKDNNIDKLQMLGLLQSNRDKTISLLDSQVANGDMSLEQKDALVNEMDVYANSVNKIPRNLDADSAAAIMGDVSKISELEQSKEGKSKYFRKKIDSEIDALNENIEKVVDFNSQDSTTKKKLLKEAKEELQKKEPNQELTQDKILNYAIQKSNTDSEIVEEKITLEELSKPDTFTHRTMSKDAITNWADGGQVIGKKEDLKDFDSRVPNNPLEAATKKEGFNRQSPNFQKGGVYSGKVKPGEFVVVTKGDNKFIPSASFQNRKTFEKSSGISTLKPDSRQLSNFDLYKVNENGELVKQNWNNYKTNKDAISKQSPKKVDDEKFTDSRKKMESNVLDSESTGKSETKSKNKTQTKTQKEIDSLNKKIEEVRADSKVNRPTKVARIKELNDKISKLETQAEAETNIEEEVVEDVLTENEKLDRDSRLTDKEAKQAQKEEGFTSLEGDAEITVPILSKIFKNFKLDISAKKNPKLAKAVNFINQITKKGLQAAGNLPKKLFTAQETKTDKYNAIVFRAERKATQFNKLFTALKKTKRLDNKALENLNEDLGKVLRGEMDAKDIKFKNNRGEVKKISTKLAQVVTQMRSDIDSMSKAILDSPNITKQDSPVEIEEEVYRNKIESQLGKYITRSYRLFEGKVKGQDYKKTLDAEVLEEAREFIKKDKGFIKEVEAEAAKTNEKFEDALNRLVESKINDLLTQKTSATDFLNTYVGESKNLKILKQRKEVPEALRKLYGEITDPVANYLTTMTKTGSLLTSANFLQSVYEAGIGKYLFTKNDPNRTEGMVEISGTNNENYTPLDGLYTYPEIADNLFPKRSPLVPRPEGKGYQGKIGRLVYDTYMKGLVAYPRAAKTILSPSTQLINLLSNINFAVANGHLPISIVNGTIGWSSYVKSAQAIRAIWNNESNEELSKRIEKYYELGIIDQSVDVRELQDLLNESDNERDIFERLSQEPTYQKKLKNSMFNPKNWYKKAAKGYRIGDDFWKIMGYEQESKVLAKTYFDKDFNDLDANESKEIEKKASEMVKNQYPNYSRIPAVARFFKRLVVAGNFISFQAESYRTAYNTVGNAYNMVVEGNKLVKDKSDVAKGKRIRKEGIRKITNIMSYMAFRDGAFYTTAVAMGGKVLGGMLPLFGLGFDDDEPKEEEKKTLGGLTMTEQAIRNFVYEWQKNQKLIITKAENGEIKFTDASTFDPHQLLEANINVLLQSKNWKDALAGLTTEQMRTFASTDFVVQAYLDADKKYKGKGKAGSFLDDFLKPFASRALLPGAILQIEDAFGKGFLSGRNITESKVGKLFGKRDYTVDVSRQLYFNLLPERTAQMKAEKDYYRSIYAFKDYLKLGGGYTKEDLKDLDKAYQEVDKDKRESFLYTLDQVRMAALLGASSKEIKRTLLSRNIGFSKKEINALVRGGYIPLKRTPGSSKRKKKSETQKALEF